LEGEPRYLERAPGFFARKTAEAILKELKRFAGSHFLGMEMGLLKTNSLKKHFAVIVRGWVAKSMESWAFSGRMTWFVPRCGHNPLETMRS
jgi:hypothetical protein